VTCDRSVVFSGNMVESGVKHHQNKQTNVIIYTENICVYVSCNLFYTLSTYADGASACIYNHVLL